MMPAMVVRRRSDVTTNGGLKWMRNTSVISLSQGLQESTHIHVINDTEPDTYIIPKSVSFF